MTHKKFEKIIYSVMTILVFLQSFIPILAVAETRSYSTAIALEKAELSEEGQSVFLKLAGRVDNEGQALEEVLSLAGGTEFVPKEAESLGVGQSTYRVSKEQLTFHISAASRGTFSIEVPLKSETLTENLTVHLGEQVINLAASNKLMERAGGLLSELTTTGETAQATNSTQSSSTASTQNSTQASETTEISNTAEISETTETSETAETSDITQVSETAETSESEESNRGKLNEPRAAAGTDIRTYFPGGMGTIIDQAEVSFYDKEGQPLEQSVPADSEIRLHYDWSIPEEVREQIQAGDTFTFHLPEGIKPLSSQSGELKDAAGKTYATYVLDEEGQVVLTFNEHVTQEFEIAGSFEYSARFDQIHIGGPGDYTITFPTEDKIPPVEVTIKPTTNTSIAKKGHFDRTPNPTEVTWEVDFNQAMNLLENPTITEKWPAGLAYESVKVYQLVMNFDGTVARVGEELSPDDYTVDEAGNLTIKGETTEAYRVVYLTQIQDEAIPEEGGQVTFVNTATLTDDKHPDGLDARATVTNTFGKMIEKKRTGYDAAKQEFSWEIAYNYGEKKIAAAEAIIRDEMSENLILTGEPLIYPITFGPNGEEIQGETPLRAGTDYEFVKNPTGNGFVIHFLQDIERAYKITYKTQVNGIVTDVTAIENRVASGSGEAVTESGTAQQQNILKSLDNSSIDYRNRTVDWTLKINANQYQMTDLRVTDTFAPVPGLTLKKTVDLSRYQLTITSSSGQELTQGTDYRVIPSFNEAKQQTGFVLEFLGTYNPTNEAFTVHYRTTFDPELIDPNTPALDHFTNRARVDWTAENGERHHSEDQATFKPTTSYALNAEKGGSYNAQTKKITWRAVINLSGNLLENAQFTDKILENQQYLAGSLKIYEAKTNPDGTAVKLDQEADNELLPAVIEPADDNQQTMTIRFPDESQHTYVIEFETSVEGKVIETAQSYDNHATYENAGQSRDVLGQVSVKNGGAHLQKSGEQDSENPDYVNWHLVINPTQSVLKNVVVVDKPSANQIVDEASIQLYQTTVAVDGTVTPDLTKPLQKDLDYTVVLTTDNLTGEQTIEVKLLHEIETAYVMNYRALINSSAAGSSDKLTNQATITGDGERVVTDNSGRDITVSIDHSGGSASGKKGQITFKKTAEDRATTLTGAHFQLWDATKSQVVREGEVDETGQITFGNLVIGDYLLVETSAPIGYTIPNDLVRGRRVSITAATSSETAEPTVVVNTPNKVILTKTNERNEGLANATFLLEKQQGALWLPSRHYTTNAQGILEIDGLLVGAYRLTEVTAPEGYLVNPTPLTFTVAQNEQNQLPTIRLSLTDYQGSAELTKVAKDGTSLAGALFNVIDAQGEIVQEGLASDEQGVVRVTNLAPGNYAFVESQAPTGYVVNTETYPFAIAEEADEKPAVVTAGQAINYQGSAELTKQDEAGNPLAGAIFRVVDEEGQTVKENLASDASGKVKIDGLRAGSYQFIETKAPAGYILNTKAVDFTIAESSKGEPAIVEAGSLINYQGAVSIQKVNSAEEPLAGAEFTLYDSQMNVLDKMISQADGQILFEHLAPGTYYLVETVAPKLPDGTDYVINPYPVEVVIPETTDNQPVKIDKGQFQNFKGTAEIQKTGAHGSIAGAEFALSVLEDGQEKFERTVVVPESGILPIEDLGAGSYKLVETKAAPGYIINSQPIYFVVGETTEDVTDALLFENYQSELIGKKVAGDGLTEAGLVGAEFQIYQQLSDGTKGDGPISFKDKSGQTLDTLTTDSTGEFYAAGLPIGRYVLIETKAPAGYVLDTTAHAFEISQQLGKPEPFDLGNIDNYRGQIDITKTNANKELLEGGTFILAQDPAGSQPVTVIGMAGEETTELHAVAGHIKAQGLQPGTYYLVETSAPTGFIVNTQPIKLVIPEQAEGKAGLTISDELINYQGSVELTKVDEADEPLAGAEFKIVDVDGETVQESLISDEAGKVKARNLAPGDYQLVETKAPDGYILNSVPVDFTIGNSASGQPEVVTIENPMINYQGSVELTKVDEENEPLARAEFKIIDVDGETVQEGLISDEDGKVKASGLAPGDYQLVETKAPDGYILNTTPVDFTIGNSNEGKPETVMIEKSIINYQGSVELTKVDEADEPLAGAEFKIVDTNGETVQESLISDEAGKVKASGLAPGDYQFVETKAPTGYILNTTPVDFTIGKSAEGQPEMVIIEKSIINYQGSVVMMKVDESDQPLAGAEFKIVDADGETVQEGLVSDEAGKVKARNLTPGDYQFIETKAPDGYILNSMPVDFAIDNSNEGKPETVVIEKSMINYQGSVELTKVDEADEPLAGAEFKIVNTDGETVQESLISDEDGKVNASRLAPGDYQLVETKAPDGYILNSVPVAFTIGNSNEGKPETVMIEKSIINYQGSVELTKVDESDEPLAGAEFKIVDADGETVQESLVSDEDGKVKVRNLAPGDYQFVETKAPDGYILNTTSIAFTIDNSNEGQPETVIIENPMINYQGSVVMMKVDESDQPLAGAEFKIVDIDGKTVRESLASDEAGNVAADGLAPGDYQLVETKAPAGYILNTKIIKFTIDASHEGKPATVDIGEHFINYQGAAELTKVDEANEPLAGAEFKVLDEQRKSVATQLISDDQGKISVAGLAPGTYQFVEVAAPTGYELNEQPVSFTIEEATENEPAVQNVGNFINKRTPEPVPNKPVPPKSEGEKPDAQPTESAGSKSTTKPLPKTNDQNNLGLVVLGIGVVIVAGILYYWKKKKN
ncbi:cell wall protein [Enterococcus sp. JM4C]|uniref:SpaA isopeptide-forming pilin-related protein n=1 Tax=Candidatus Enterococcus huntleyi TaxID=1857217 RepID=UPI00137A47FD|nr:SpaA isopeptide-forming pilin-related protein [Enterococcus sp. JM4C]KAF1298342.1 cell wall protein [Enterococcus sp. JM4C]